MKFTPHFFFFSSSHFIALMTSPVKKHKGRSASDFWPLFTDAEEPHLSKFAECKYCCTVVSYHCKSEQAQTHLRSCAPFRREMMKRHVQDRPAWFTVPKARCIRQCDSSESDSGQQKLSGFVLPRLKETEMQAFWRLLAMFFFVTGTSFQRIENPYLLQALQVLYFFLVCLVLVLGFKAGCSVTFTQSFRRQLA